VSKYDFKSLQKLSLLTLESLRLSGNEFQADDDDDSDDDDDTRTMFMVLSS